METYWRIVLFVHDEPSPRDMLTIASAATKRAQRATTTPKWLPPTAALLGGASIIVVGLARPESDDTVFWSIMAAGIGIFCGFIVVTAWVWRTERKRGVVTRRWADLPMRRWQRYSLFLLLTLVPGLVQGFLDGWAHVVFALILTAAVWWGLERQRRATCPS
jgi:cbb3-type cytochrome oxidase subunit 3